MERMINNAKIMSWRVFYNNFEIVWSHLVSLIRKKALVCFWYIAIFITFSDITDNIYVSFTLN